MSLVPLLYWFGLVVTLLGVGLRFWSLHDELGLVVALAGIAVMVLARVAMWMNRRKSRENNARV